MATTISDLRGDLMTAEHQGTWDAMGGEYRPQGIRATPAHRALQRRYRIGHETIAAPLRAEMLAEYEAMQTELQERTRLHAAA